MLPNYYSRINSTATVLGVGLRTVYRAIGEMERVV
jgi:hypothetical protein